jgi:hypothetical protein
MTLPLADRLRPRAPSRTTELLMCAALTGAIAALLIRFGPAPGDAAVHLYRTFLVRSGALVWDNFWYEGDYPLASYSLLYYFPAAIVGNIALVMSAAVASTVLFGSIARREWGGAAVWPSRVFGICAAAPLFTGLYSYALGFAAMLAALRALQSRRAALACVLAALTLGFSPLAFVFLCLLLASVVVVRRRLTPSAVAIGVTVALLAGFELVVLRLFPSGGVYPFHAVNAACLLGVCGLGALLARRARADLLTAFFVLWGVGGLVAALVPSPIGDNWTRLNEYVLPLMLLTAFLARFRPRRLVVLALAAALAYNLAPYLLLIPYRLDARPAAASFWRPAIDFLRMHARPGYRVEVVPTAAHWDAYWLARGGFPIARGWYRQLDVVDNPVLYRRRLGADAYRRWLRSVAVEYVLLPSTKLDFVSAPQEARLLRSGRSGLDVVFRSANWTIYRLPRPTPLLTGGAPARITTFGHTTVAGNVSAPGTYLLRTHYVDFWSVHGAVCVRPAPGKMTLLVASSPGRFTLTVGDTADALLRAATGGDACGSRTRTSASGRAG